MLFDLGSAAIVATLITVIGGIATLFGAVAALLLTGTTDPVIWAVAGGFAAIALGLALERLTNRRPHFMRASRVQQHTQRPRDVEL